MKKISYKGYRFPPEIIQQAIWLYVRFTAQVRAFAKALGQRAKTDPIDAIVIARFAMSTKPEISPLPDEATRCRLRRARFLDERQQMMQDWADYLDRVATSGKVIHMDFAQAAE